MVDLQKLLEAAYYAQQAMDERGSYPDELNRFGLTVGECDWVTEIHRLLAGFNHNRQPDQNTDRRKSREFRVRTRRL